MQPPIIKVKRSSFFEYDSANNLPAYLTECRPARNTFRFQRKHAPYDAVTLPPGNWLVLRRPPYPTMLSHDPPASDEKLPPIAPKAHYVTTLTSLHRSAANALPFHTLRRLAALCSTAFEQLYLPLGTRSQPLTWKSIYHLPWQPPCPSSSLPPKMLRIQAWTDTLN